LSSPSWRWIRQRRFLQSCGAIAASLATLWLAGCLYGFAGGGLPNIKTVAILPFDNDTPEPVLTQEVAAAVQQAIEGRLGLRASGEATADAVVRGRIARYDSDLPVTVQTGVGQANVTRRLIQITVDVTIVDQREGKTLWQRQGLTVTGDYQPPQEADGRKIALEKLVTEIVDGAQSQW
jgi:hypothetical protein